MAQSRRTRQGEAPTTDAAKLARRDYAERVLANLGEQRHLADNFLREMGVFDPNGLSIDDIRRMRRDAMIKMGLYYSKAPLIRAKWSMKCEDPQIREGMTEIVRNVRQSWMRTALNKLDFGYQAAVKNYELGKIDATYEHPGTGAVMPVWDDDVVQPVILGTPIPIPPEYARVNLDQGRFNGIDTTVKVTTTRNQNDDENHIPPEWSLWFVNEFEEEFRNYYGVSRIAPAYEPWYAYWFTFHMRSRHIEMDADPALQVWYPPGTYEDKDDPNADGTPKIKSNRQAALEIGAALRGGGTIAWPSDVHIDEQGKASAIALWRAEFLTGGENLDAFNTTLNDLETAKLRACLVPEEALISHTGGLNSGGKVSSYGEIFNESLEMEAAMLDEVWNRHQIRDIVEANWGKDAPKCEIVTESFQEEDLSLAAELIKIAFNTDPNALPIDFGEILDQLGVPQLTGQERQDREEAAAEAQEQALEEERATAEAAGEVPPTGAPPVAPGSESVTVGPLPGELAASQETRRKGPRKYERERINLGAQAPGWAKREGIRRDRNVLSLAERLMVVAELRYEDAFEAAADAIARSGDELNLGIADLVDRLIDRIGEAVRERTSRWQRRLRGEMAGIYHAAGAAELMRLGLNAESWDIGRDEVQEWARHHAGELVKTIDTTVVEKEIRPWLTDKLGKLGIQDGQGVPFGAEQLAQELTDKYESYPRWMAERLVRTEAMRGYNFSAADMWERVGVEMVEEYDGLGGRTGHTDADCLARNGRIVTIEQFRKDIEDEHPNGTLGGLPITADVELRPIQPTRLADDVAVGLSVYSVTRDGRILTEAEMDGVGGGADAS